jgi:MerR family transcriptional regulator, light-induced transcriptional regulator
MNGLAIREVAEQTGLAAGTIRMWEQRYGFPEPERTAAGYRLYSAEDVDTLRRVVTLRESGLSVSAALERARAASTTVTDRPSIFGAVASSGRTRVLRKRTLIALSRAIEDETLARAAGPVVLGAFQRERHFRAVAHRYQRLAAAADAAVVFADFAEPRQPADGPAEVPIEPRSAIGHEWAVVIDAPAFSVCLCAWEPPVRTPPAHDFDREFETFWTLNPSSVRQAAIAGAAVAAVTAPTTAQRLQDVLASRPLAAEGATEALEALTARMIGYLETA